MRVSLVRSLFSTVVEELDLWVHIVQPAPEMDHSIKMEVGIEDLLHIEFEFQKQKYHLNDVIVGKIFFLLVKVPIHHMEMSILRRETTRVGLNEYDERDVLSKFEIMDGGPVRDEIIPVRMYLGSHELTPTRKDVNNKFSLRWYLNLVIVDTDERRYYKHQEIVLWRGEGQDS